MEKITKEKYRIAVIEDDEVLSKSLAGELGDAGFDVVKAFDGEQGLEVILKEIPDLVLLDIVMPKMDGMTMMKRLRASNEYGAHVPIILLTNLNTDDKILAGIVQDKPAYYLVKSNYTVADLVTKVRACLEKPIA